MLVSLHIENIAVIRCADIDFSQGFCVLTGETGAGKSLLVDSINLLTGGRVSRELIRTGEDKAMISAVFTVDTSELVAALETRGVDVAQDDEIMLQRVITRDGKAQARINGRAVTQALLREVGETLINIHGQSDNQKLMQPESHRGLLDAYAQDADELEAYTSLYARWKSVRDEMGRLKRDMSERIRTREMLEYQIADIDAAKLKAGEEEKLEERKKRLQHQEKIQRQVRVSLRALQDGEKATVSLLLDRVESALSQITDMIPDCEGLVERISAMKYEAEDVAERLRELSDEDMQDPTAELDRIESRLDTISRLGRKYGDSVEEILAFREQAAARLYEIDMSDELISELSDKERLLSDALAQSAGALTEVRASAALALSQAVQEALAFLDMPKVRFDVRLTPTDTFTPEGMDDVEFMIATNSGEPLLPMVKIASGGELSRIMLAVRSVLNKRYGVPTSIYDEIDTGISGRTARKVGIKLARISGETQVVCVTHSAQIASLADAHYVIEKCQHGDRAETRVRLLTEDERVDEVARILGGLDVTDSQRTAALDLIKERENL